MWAGSRGISEWEEEDCDGPSSIGGQEKVSRPEGLLGRVLASMGTRMLRPVYAKVADALELAEVDELLDVACGEGAFLAEQAAKVRFVAGIDISSTQVTSERRRNHARIVQGTAEVVHGDVTALPWPGERVTPTRFQRRGTPTEICGERTTAGCSPKPPVRPLTQKPIGAKETPHSLEGRGQFTG